MTIKAIIKTECRYIFTNVLMLIACFCICESMYNMDMFRCTEISNIYIYRQDGGERFIHWLCTVDLQLPSKISMCTFVLKLQVQSVSFSETDLQGCFLLLSIRSPQDRGKLLSIGASLHEQAPSPPRWQVPWSVCNPLLSPVSPAFST